ncbi:MAG TPA: thiamine pyrophosphate-requiring protein [Gaiellaceae bacterium]|jgi:pyruvate dehydrogenase (quinone)|nr:thiamine pyrophosphate-requiring protein [Gaiellaceae bacterium]
MAQLVADYVLKRLTDWGVHRLYGYPGDGINGFLGALDRAEGDPEFIQVRHEEMSAFMACGHAKFTGEVGVCLATSGPGAIHLLNGLYDAKLDHQPVVAVVGQQKRMSLGGHYQQEVDLTTLFKDVSEYVQVCMEPAQARHLVDRAIRIALDQRTVTTIVFPGDVQEEEAVPSPPRKHGAIYSSVGYTRPRVLPHPADLERAATVLNEGEKVAMLIGQGAQGAAAEVVETAELLGAGVAKALLGRAALPDDLPFVTGPIGLLGSRPSYELMEDCDTLLMVGSSFPYSEWLPKEGQARGVQIDVDGRMLGIRYPMEVPLVGDAKETLRALIPLLERKEDRSWRRKIEEGVAEWWRLMEERAMLEGDPINPQRVVHELSKRLPDGCILTADSGSSTNWWARQLRLREGMLASLSGTLATMGPGVPYAIAAKFAFPERPVIAFVGDGAFQMNGMNEMLTVAKYWERWSDPRLVFCIFNNGDLNQVTWEQRVLAGDPKYPASQVIPDFPAARYAELVGLHGLRVDRPDDVAGAWEEALSSDRPTVLEAVVDPEIPPLPPHIRVEQMKKMAEAMVKGDPERVDVMEKSLRGKLQEFLPGR